MPGYSDVYKMAPHLISVCMLFQIMLFEACTLYVEWKGTGFFVAGLY
jgi:hypothetical protein